MDRTEAHSGSPVSPARCALRSGVLGFVFGALFPVGAVLAEALLRRGEIESVTQIWIATPAHAVVWTAPLVLAGVFWWSCVRSAQLRREKERAEHAENVLRHLVRHDPLTGLANRHCLTEDTIDQSGTGGHLLLLDLDGFKKVNDTLGHGVGDELLVAVAERMRATVGGDGVVYRLGGDEFVVVMCETIEAQVLEVSERLVKAFADPFEVDSARLSVGCSIGVAHCADQCAGLSEALRRADVALYDVKTSGGGGIAVWDHQHDRPVDRTPGERVAAR